MKGLIEQIMELNALGGTTVSINYIEKYGNIKSAYYKKLKKHEQMLIKKIKNEKNKKV